MMDNYITFDDTKGNALLDSPALFKDICSDPAVFKQLYLTHIRSIYRYIFSKVGEARQTEDLTAQVFLEALESLPHYRHDGHFAAWLYSIARHKVADYFRSQHPEIPIEVATWDAYKKSDPLSTLIQTEEAQRISKLILQLDENDQELLRLRFVAELSFGDISRLVHSSSEATKKRCYRLLIHLRQQLELDHD